MSRRKDGGFPRRKHGNCNKPYRQMKEEEDEKGESSQKNKRTSEKPPRGLKGKELGLWYRDRQVNKNKKMEEERAVPEIRLPSEKLAELEQLLFDVRNVSTETNLQDGVFKSAYLSKIKGTFQESIAKYVDEEISPDTNLDKELSNLMSKREKSRAYQEMLDFRSKLPCYLLKDKILETINDNQVVVISGETGCGKTTQIAQYVLDDYIAKGHGSLCNIVCTQPRRISAVSVAERVAVERDEELGKTVGYQIRLEKVLPKMQQGSILFVTTGILLQWMQGNPCLNGITHIFLDEIHERDILTDFVITFLKFIIDKRPTLKVILMSATLNAERFSKYFGKVPCLHIPGFTFPVEELYLDQVLMLTKFRYHEYRGKPNHQLKQKNKNEFQEVIFPHIKELKYNGFINDAVAAQLRNPYSELINYDLIVELIRHVCAKEGEGAILVFVPGLTDIQSINRILSSNGFFNSSTNIIIPLHSTLPTINQRRIFNKPPKGVRKIIIATNIAETSITIDDVVFVIDSGFIKMKNFNQAMNVSTLDSQWVSLANAHQRRGRAGRVQPGKCYKLYTKAREMLFESYPLPEMQRSSLEEVVLQAKMLQLGRVASFLCKLMDPPDPKTVELSLETLLRLNALNSEEQLTPLGFHLAKLPMDPQTGKMILMAAIFSCVDPILSIAAALSFKEPFYTPMGKDDLLMKTKKEFAQGEKSDHLVISTALQQYEEWSSSGSGFQFARENFLSINTLDLLQDVVNPVFVSPAEVNMDALEFVYYQDLYDDLQTRKEMKGQFARHLHNMNFLSSANPKDTHGNLNSKNTELVKAILCSGLYPNVALIKFVKRRGDYFEAVLKGINIPKILIHRKSICSKISYFESPYIIYHLIMQSSSIYIHDATMINPWPLLFFGERLDIVEFDKVHGVRVNEIIKVNCYKKTAKIIQKLRGHLDAILATAISNPSVISWKTESDKRTILRAIVQLITAENEELMAPPLEED